MNCMLLGSSLIPLNCLNEEVEADGIVTVNVLKALVLWAKLGMQNSKKPASRHWDPKSMWRHASASLLKSTETGTGDPPTVTLTCSTPASWHISQQFSLPFALLPSDHSHHCFFFFFTF